MTQPYNQSFEEPQGEARSNAEQLPLYNWQLQDVVLWQLDVRRSRIPLGKDSVEDSHLNVNVEIAPSGQTNDVPAARLALDYAFPGNEPPGYSIHIELIGVFGQRQTLDEAGLEVQEAEEFNADEGPTLKAQIPLNDYTVIALLWPYMRELAHQLQLRMRVQAPLLPTLDLANLQNAPNTTDTSPEPDAQG